MKIVRRIAATVALMVSLTVVSGPGVGLGAAWGGLEVISAEAPAKVEIPKDTALHEVASIDLPKGSWMVIATAGLVARGSGRCVLGTAATGHTIAFGAPITTSVLSQDTPRFSPTFIQQVTAPAVGVRVRLRCNLAGGPDPFLRVEQVRLDAMRIGRLTSKDLDTGDSVVSGADKPAMLYAHRDTERTVTQAGTKLATLDLPAGTWWIQAVVPLRRAQGDGGPTRMYPTCRLAAGANADTAVIGLSQKVLRMPAVLQLVQRSTSASKAVVRCESDASTSVMTGQIRVVALRVGTLVTRTITGTHTVGSGEPTLVSTIRQSAFVATGPDTFSTILRLPDATVDDARWRVAATTQMDSAVQTFGLARCRVRVDDGHQWTVEAGSLVIEGRSVSQSMVADLTPGPVASATFACTGGSPGGDTELDYRNTRLTALRLGSWSLQP